MRKGCSHRCEAIGWTWLGVERPGPSGRQWGGRKDRKFFWMGKRDRAAARVLLKRKEQELALIETGDLERRIAETVAARFEQSIAQIVPSSN